jgi:protein TonB
MTYMAPLDLTIDAGSGTKSVEREAVTPLDYRPGAADDVVETPPASTTTEFSVDPLEAIPVLPARQAIYVAALLVSLLTHGALVGWLVHRPPVHAIGAGGQDLEAVSVEVISASALESLSARASQAASGDAGPVADTAGVDAPAQPEVEAARATEPEPIEEVDQPPPAPTDIVAKPDPVPNPDDTLVASETPARPPEKPEPPPKEAPSDPRPEPPKQKPVEKTPEPEPELHRVVESQAQAAIVSGGATARSAEESIESESAAGAAPGELARYAIAVRLALGRARPAHVGRRGTVIVTFQLSTIGAVETAEIFKTSGRGELDRVALAAVKSAKFPAPPPGSTEQQRTYTVPFEFK